MQVNNIIIDNDLTSLNSNEYNIIYQNKTTIINIMGEVYINDFSNNLNQQNLTINLKENSSLIYNKYSNQNLEDYQLTINSSDNTEFKLNFSVIAKKPLNININNLIKGNNNASTIRLRIIGEQDVNAIVSAQVLKNTKNNTILEDLKGLNVYAKKIAIKNSTSIIYNVGKVLSLFSK